ncbi:TPA: helix-turn-helix domain-containing protein [Enterobacter hormaechei subsp. xiangfangensis]|nr:helix-turn-helix domain-containing protein [Enterobacter hormaechei subsp. xiangfangensis]
MNTSIMTDTTSPFVFADELAQIFQIKPQTLRVWISGGHLPKGLPRPFKINRRNAWSRVDIEDYINSQRKSDLRGVVTNEGP